MSDLLAEPFLNMDKEEQAPQKPPHEDFEQIGDARYYHRLVQGCMEWLDLRLGMLTASEFSKVLTPTLKIADNAGTRSHIYDLASQRITQRALPTFVSFDMERGNLEEIEARKVYNKQISPVAECGFVINETLGFPLGFSPDGLVGDLGQIEVKSRVPKYQLQTIVEHIASADPVSPIPTEFMLQVQSGLFITGREWCDFCSYSNGMNMAVIRVYPIEEYQTAIKKAAIQTEEKITQVLESYQIAQVMDKTRIYQVEYIDHSQEISL